MDLRNFKLYHAGEELNFAVFSDDLCHARYLKSIPLPMTYTEVDVYEIEPGAKSQWVVVKQKDGDKNNFRFFIRTADKFLENETQNVSKELKQAIMQRFPNLTTEFQRPRAA